MVRQDDVEQIIHFPFFKCSYLLRLFLHIVHTQDDMSNHTTMRSKPGADLSLEFLQFAYIMKQRSSKNQVMITWIEAGSQLGNCGNVYGMFKQAANNGSVVSYCCGPAAKTFHHFNQETLCRYLFYGWLLLLQITSQRRRY